MATNDHFSVLQKKKRNPVGTHGHMYWSLEKGEKEVSAMDDPLNLFSLAKEAMVMPVDAIIYLLFASSQV